jgi:hypothetical protein
VHKEERHNLDSSLNGIKMIESKRMRRAVYVARMGKMTNVFRFLVGKINDRTTYKT